MFIVIFVALNTLLLPAAGSVVLPENFYGSEILMRSQCKNVTKYIANFTLSNYAVGTLKLEGQGSAVTESLRHLTPVEAAGSVLVLCCVCGCMYMYVVFICNFIVSSIVIASKASDR